MKKQASEEEMARKHESGLVTLGVSLEAVPLRDVWVAIAAAIEAVSPPADAMVLDERRLGELPSRWPRSRGWMKDRSLGKWNGAVDQLAVPAWDMRATLRSGSGVADTFSIDRLPLYLGGNGVLYCAPGRATPNGTLAEWEASYRSAGDVPGAWTARWLPYGTYYPRQEVADALRSLAALHNLNPAI